MVTIILVILYVFKWPLSPKDRFNQRERGLNPLQLLIDGRRKPIDEKNAGYSPRMYSMGIVLLCLRQKKISYVFYLKHWRNASGEVFNTKITLSV